MRFEMSEKHNGHKQMEEGKVTPEFKALVDKVFKEHKKVLDELAKH